MKLTRAARQKAKIKMALQGPAGAGKTYSALLLAKGIVGSLEKVAIIDSESGSAHLYSNLGDYHVLQLEAPYSPEKYCEAIDKCLESGMELIVIDSISHCYEYLLDYHSSLQGNSFTNWSKVTPRHKAFINKILQSPVHFIATIRTKSDYILNKKDGKYVPEKVGLKAITKEGTDFEFTIVFDLDSKHFARSSKDRTNLFANAPEFKISEGTGKKILKWCESGVTNDQILDKISKCESEDELKKLYRAYPDVREELVLAFKQKKNQLLNEKNYQENGTDIIKK